METNFIHHQSAHCENGVASNLLKHRGINISEPMVFGIGSGILFFYLPLLKVNHAPAISYRPMPGFIFNRAAKRLGIKVKRIKFSNEKSAQIALEENLKNNMIPFLNLQKINDQYSDEIQDAVNKVVSSGWYLQGEANKTFEKNYSNYIGTKHTIGVANGLDALRLILRAYIELGLMKEGDEVVVPINTYIASILAITDNNLVPIFVEPDPKTLQIDD
mgnify:CR=1 FL=1